MTHRRRITTITLAATLAGALAISAPAAPAMAQPASHPSGTYSQQPYDAWEDARRSVLAGVQAYARAALDQRLRTLTHLASRVNDAEHVSADHAAQLLGDYQAARSGLESLNDRIQLSTSVEEALHLTEKMASDYRVYVVLVPKTAEVVIGASFVVASGQIDEAIDGVLDVVDALEQFGHPVANIRSALDDARVHADAALDLADGVPGSVISLAAFQWPSPAQALLNTGRADLESSGSEIRMSIGRLHHAIQLIRDLAAN